VFLRKLHKVVLKIFTYYFTPIRSRALDWQYLLSNDNNKLEKRNDKY